MDYAYLPNHLFVMHQNAILYLWERWFDHLNEIVYPQKQSLFQRDVMQTLEDSQNVVVVQFQRGHVLNSRISSHNCALFALLYGANLPASKTRSASP